MINTEYTKAFTYYTAVRLGLFTLEVDMKKLIFKLVTALLIIGNLFNIYIFIFQIPKINYYPLEAYEIEDYTYYSRNLSKWTPIKKSGFLGWCKDFDIVKYAVLNNNLYFLTEKTRGGYSTQDSASVNFIEKNTYWLDTTEYEINTGESVKKTFKRIGYDAFGNIIWLQFEENFDIPKLEEPEKETELLAKDYFEKYISKNLRAETDNNSEYKCYYIRRGHMNTQDGASEFPAIYDDYNNTEYDEIINSISDYPDMSTVLDYFKYTFVKFINGVPTDEYIDIYVYENGELYKIYVSESHPLLFDDILEYDEKKVNEGAKEEIRKYYEVNNAEYYKDKKIIDIRISKNLPYKDALGRRGIHSYAVVEFENGERATNSTYTLLEDVSFSIRYPLVSFIIIEAALLALTVGWLIWRKKNKKI